jgi:hypothetical protein
MTNPRDTQFSEWAELLWEEIMQTMIESGRHIDVGTDPAIYRKIISRRVYDLAQFIVSQAYADDLKPKEILYKNGKPVLMYPENLKEWYESKGKVNHE